MIDTQKIEEMAGDAQVHMSVIFIAADVLSVVCFFLFYIDTRG